ncbi:MAG: cytosine permease, partial [Micromonosporaceae bacterium]|nr:cytosine permease [Micromonosporaceae bacterium]
PAVAPVITHGSAGRTEPGLRLRDPQPRTLGGWDQGALWGNLGLTLLGPVNALFILQPAGFPAMSLLGALSATVAGTLAGTLLLALSTVVGSRTGAPAMVLMRGLFGLRLSYAPTALNLLQCLGWAMFELWVIATALAELLPWHAYPVYVLAAGALTTLMALRPLGVVRVLRRYALVAVALAAGYLFVQLARHPLPSLTAGSWSGFWVAVDTPIAVAVSWVPLAADYTRHARTGRSAFAGSLAGYGLAQIGCFTLGLLAFATLAGAAHGGPSPAGADPQSQLFGAFLAVPAGFLAFAVLIARELDESFTNVYSTAVSVQNLRPLTDRRLLAVVTGALATAGALVLHVADYQNFLYLIGSVFVPLTAVLVVWYFGVRRGTGWDTSDRAPARPLLLVPWLLGFIAYQLVNPGSVGWWASAWTSARSFLHLYPPAWLSASVCAFAVAALATFAVALLPAPRVAVVNP